MLLHNCLIGAARNTPRMLLSNSLWFKSYKRFIKVPGIISSKKENQINMHMIYMYL